VLDTLGSRLRVIAAGSAVSTTGTSTEPLAGTVTVVGPEMPTEVPRGAWYESTESVKVWLAALVLRSRKVRVSVMAVGTSRVWKEMLTRSG
jgi:hypothetical protein